jgi:hypothetical protein
VVRIHRAGEGVPFTGLTPAGLGHGPVVPVAEKAVETGSPEELVKLLTDAVEGQIRERFEHVMHLLKREAATGESVDEVREYVEVMLGLEVYSQKLYECAPAEPHGEGAHTRSTTPRRRHHRLADAVQVVASHAGHPQPPLGCSSGLTGV